MSEAISSLCWHDHPSCSIADKTISQTHGTDDYNTDEPTILELAAKITQNTAVTTAYPHPPPLNSFWISSVANWPLGIHRFDVCNRWIQCREFPRLYSFPVSRRGQNSERRGPRR